jgi:hypothetical protein
VTSLPMVSDVEDHVTINIVGVLKRAPDFFKTVPPDYFYDTHPSSDFGRGIWVVLNRLAQMLTSNDMHCLRILHIL